MDSTLRVSLRLSKINYGDFVTAFNTGYILAESPKKSLNKSSPRKRGSSNPLALEGMDSRFRGNDGLIQSFLRNFQ